MTIPSLQPGTIRRLVPMVMLYMGSSGSLLASSAAQLVTFAILARYLGVEQFGLYAIITAVTNVGVQLCGLGAQESLIRRVAQDPGMYPKMLGHAYILSAASGLVLFLIGLAILPVVAPVSDDLATTVVAMGLILASNLILLKIISLATQSYIAHSRFATANRIEVAFAAFRTVAAVLGCLVFGVASVAGWAWWHFAAHVAAAAVALMATRRLGWPQWTIVREEIRIGLLFSTQFLFKALRGNADLLVLGVVASSEILGSYSITRRLVESSYLSIEALNRLIYPGSAQIAVSGIHNAAGRIRRVLLAALFISFGTATAMFILSPWLPLIFGAEYVSLVWLTRALCWVVVLMAVYVVALEALGAAGLQGARAAILNTGNILGAGLVALATWEWSIGGTLASYYVVELGIAVAAWIVLLRKIRIHREAAERACAV
ncbi:MAG: lipopolysaccharide biosynthesis protein [Aquamicrobium sp.]|uniref:lipopolysaccharide biosynthesis protein n=1 Tax=Aquamicrobium sp. TaxID=1872579 RepID=UPI00349E8810|nr:lipopolysaccharide biosynthesis protein [Aquamicrobium sp.]